MPGTYPPLLAGGLTSQGRFDPFDLYAGESDIVTDQGQVADGLAIQQFQVLMRDGATNRYIVFAVGAGNKAVAIAAQPLAATTPGGWLPVFTGGVFNHEALLWPGGLTTLEARKAVFDGSNIGVRQLL
jgi:Bacteriophage lambda head decoration protein D